MPICPNCRNTIGPGFNICNFCGQVLSEQTPTQLSAHQGDHRQILIDKFVNLDFMTIAVTTICLLVAVGTLIIVVLTLLPDPSIKVTPPPGWFEVSEETMEELSEAWVEEWPEDELVCLFLNNSDNNKIIVTELGIPATADIPDTDDFDVMASFIAENREEIKEAIIEVGEWELETMEPRSLACNDIAIYYEFSRHVGGGGSALVVREESTLFTISIYI